MSFRALFRCAMTCYILTASTASGQKIYWSDIEDEVIYRSNLDGSAMQSVAGGSADTIALDMVNDRIYWGDGGGAYWALLNGVAPDRISILPYWVQIRVDTQGEYLYFVRNAPSAPLTRSALDGSHHELLGEPGLPRHGLAIDINADAIYLLDTIGLASIVRTNLDGLDPVDVLHFETGVFLQDGLELDTSMGRLFWIQKYAGIFSSTVDGRDVVELTDQEGWSLALDESNGVLYWADAEGIWRMPSDGSDNPEIVIHREARAVAIDPRVCTGHGKLVGNECVCDPGWGGADCDCSSMACPAACSGNGTCECGVCLCEGPWTGESCATAPAGTLYMTCCEDQASAPTGENTKMFIAQGGQARVFVWLADDQQRQLLNGYQLIWPTWATPKRGAVGSVSYVDEVGDSACTNFGRFFGLSCDPGNPTACGGAPDHCIRGHGASVFLDAARQDYVFTGHPAIPAVYAEEAMWFGMFSALADYAAGVQVEPGPRYLAEFMLEASAGAHGVFELAFSLTPPATALFTPAATEFFADMQSLEVIVTVCGDGVAEGDEDCDDGNTFDEDGCSSACEREPPPVPAMSRTAMVAFVLVLLCGVILLGARSSRGTLNSDPGQA